MSFWRSDPTKSFFLLLLKFKRLSRVGLFNACTYVTFGPGGHCGSERDTREAFAKNSTTLRFFLSAVKIQCAWRRHVAIVNLKQIVLAKRYAAIATQRAFQSHLWLVRFKNRPWRWEKRKNRVSMNMTLFVPSQQFKQFSVVALPGRNCYGQFRSRKATCNGRSRSSF